MAKKSSIVRNGLLADEVAPRSANRVIHRNSTAIHVIVVLESISLNIIASVLPYMAKKIDTSYIFLLTTKQIANLLGSLFYGRCMDLYGASTVLSLTLLADIAVCLILSIADGPVVLFISQLPYIFSHGFSGAQIVIADFKTERSDRADAFGKLCMSYGLGLVIGPYIGGFLGTHYGERFASGASIAGCIVATTIVWMDVPNSTKTTPKVDTVEQGSVFDLKAILSPLGVPAVALAIGIRTLVAVPAITWQSMFAMVNIDKFGLNPQDNGYFMSYIGVLTILMQGFGIKILTTIFQESLLLKLSLVVITTGYFILIQVESIWCVALCQLLTVPWEGVVDVLANSAVTKMVPERNTGTALGVYMATDCVVRLLSPTLGGYIYSWVGLPGFGILGFVMNGVTTLSLITVFIDIQLSQ